MRTPIAYLFVRQNNKECELAKKIMDDASVPFELVDVEKNNVANHMWFDVGSFSVPILATRELVLSGAKCIKLYLHKSSKSM